MVEVREGVHVVVGVSSIVHGQDMLVKNCYKIFISNFLEKISIIRYEIYISLSGIQNHMFVYIL